MYERVAYKSGQLELKMILDPRNRRSINLCRKLAGSLNKYKKMIVTSLLFFYLGCALTLNFMKIDCTDAVKTKHKSDYSKVEYAILILSGPSNLERRNAIRNSWMNFQSNLMVSDGQKVYDWSLPIHGTKSGIKPGFIKFFFVIGTEGLTTQALQEIKDENIKRNDLLLLEDLKDDYSNLTVKMLKAFAWFSENFSNMKYLIKCDDDSFVRVDLIIHEIEQKLSNKIIDDKFISEQKEQGPFSGIYWGYFKGNARVFKSGKWQEKEWFLCDHYLPYAVGGGYVISKNIVDYVGTNADVLSQYNSEDVSMGVWTSVLKDVNRLHDIRFDTQWRSRGCHNYMFIRHKQSPTDMLRLYKILIQYKGEKLCRTEETVMKPYLYNWTVLPSGCCK